MSIRTRFAPSPTGYLHIGGARTALFCWLWARKHGGRFILRIEDTDLERSTLESVNAILEGMTWLGLSYDEGPFYQTERFGRYREIIQQLLEQGHAYRCYCTREELDAMREEQMANKRKPRYDGRCRHRTEPRPGVDPVIRFRNPELGEVVVDDLIRGKVVFSNEELDDLIIARSDGSPTYNLCVVVDDLEMNITHVIRGDDHLNNTPRQINILKALGVEPPVYAHVPMILGADGARLSKRHGAVSVLQYRDDGYLPEALLNYLVRLGWSHGDQEIFTPDEMIALFDVQHIHHNAASFNPDKLLWLNHHHIMHGDPVHVANHLRFHLGRLGIDPTTGPDPVEVVLAQRERCKTLVQMAAESAFFYRELEGYDEKAAGQHLKPAAVPVLIEVAKRLKTLAEWAPEPIHGVLEASAQALGLKMGKVGPPIRVAVCGSMAAPSLDRTLHLLGRERSLERLERAIALLEAPA